MFLKSSPGLVSRCPGVVSRSSLILAVTPLTFCNLHPVMAHAVLALLLIPEPYCSLFVFSSQFPWAPGQWEEKVTVNIALKSSPPPSLGAPEDGTGDQWVSTSFLRRATSTVQHQTSMNPSLWKTVARWDQELNFTRTCSLWKLSQFQPRSAHLIAVFIVIAW